MWALQGRPNARCRATTAMTSGLRNRTLCYQSVLNGAEETERCEALNMAVAVWEGLYP